MAFGILVQVAPRRLFHSICSKFPAFGSLPAGIQAFSFREICDDRRDIGVVDWRFVDIDHLVNLRLPGHLRKRRLIQYHVGGMAGEAVVVDGIGLGATWELLIPRWQIRIHRFECRQVLNPCRRWRQCRSVNKANTRICFDI